MNREQAKKWQKEIAAFADGVTIEYRSTPNEPWQTFANIGFEGQGEYRIAPKPDKWAKEKAAFEDGKRIEYRPSLNDPWSEILEPEWLNRGEYRVKPELRYRPWKEEEVPVCSTVRNKVSGGKWSITGAKSDRVYIDGNNFGAERVLQEFTMLDGSTCGVLEEEK